MKAESIAILTRNDGPDIILNVPCRLTALGASTSWVYIEPALISAVVNILTKHGLRAIRSQIIIERGEYKPHDDIYWTRICIHGLTQSQLNAYSIWLTNRIKL